MFDDQASTTRITTRTAFNTNTELPNCAFPAALLGLPRRPPVDTLESSHLGAEERRCILGSRRCELNPRAVDESAAPSPPALGAPVPRAGRPHPAHHRRSFGQPLVQMYRRRDFLTSSGHRIASTGACVGVNVERELSSDVRRVVARLTVTVEEAAVMLGISRTSAYGCASRNEIPTVRLGRRLVVPLARLVAMLDTEPPAPSGDPADVEEVA